MIRNERQYQITLRQRNKLSDALNRIPACPATVTLDPGTTDEASKAAFIAEIERSTLLGQINDLNHELREYEALRAGTYTQFKVSSFTELPDALIRARIAKGWTQRDLAERLGMKPQQVQRYEEERYLRASTSRLAEVMEALGIDFEADVQLAEHHAPFKQLKRRLLSLGLHRQFVERRLLQGADDKTPPTRLLAYAERAARLLSTTVRDLLDDNAPLPQFATTARFKAPRNASKQAIDSYTRYAETVADIALKATAHLGNPSAPGTSREIREAIDAHARRIAPPSANPDLSSTILLSGALHYLYSLNIPVVPLNDPGGFHGACFSRDGRSVIVLKQTTNSPGRWLADLLHEIDHLRDPEKQSFRSWIELGDVSEWSDAPEEKHANDFAADILFSGRAAAVLTQCLERAEGSVERLKSIIPRVAREAEVPEDVLANYLAFQLTPRGFNWWGTAATFQQEADPRRITADLLLQRLDLTVLDAVERDTIVDVVAT